MTLLGLLLASPMLSRCGLQDWLDAKDRENFEHACANLGIARGYAKLGPVHDSAAGLPRTKNSSS
jgi:hypothetical protein